MNGFELLAPKDVCSVLWCSVDNSSCVSNLEVPLDGTSCGENQVGGRWMVGKGVMKGWWVAGKMVGGGRRVSGGRMVRGGRRVGGGRMVRGGRMIGICHVL